MKKLLSVFLAVMLSATLCTVSAHAANDAREAEVQRKKLGTMITTYENYEIVYGEGNPYDSVPSDYYETWDRLCSLYYRNTATAEEYRQGYEAACDLVFNDRFINVNYAEQTYQNALEETYSAFWYAQEEWNVFQDKLSGLGLALASYNENNEQTKKNLTDAFHGMLKAYNVMTNHNLVLGDVNGDQKVNVYDITELQRSVAEMTRLNGAQKMRAAVCGDRRCEKIGINDATRLQQYLAEFTDNMLDNRYSAVNYPVFVSEARTNAVITEEFLMERMLNFAICPRNDGNLYDITNGFYCGKWFAEQMTPYL